jgi:hypothetical protein
MKARSQSNLQHSPRSSLLRASAKGLSLQKALRAVANRFIPSTTDHATPATPFEPLEQRQLMYDAVANSITLLDQYLNPIDANHQVFAGDPLFVVVNSSYTLDQQSVATGDIWHSDQYVDSLFYPNYGTSTVVLKNQEWTSSINEAWGGLNTFRVDLATDTIPSNFFEPIGSFHDLSPGNNSLSVSFTTRTTDLSVSSIRIVDADNVPVTEGVAGQTVYLRATLARQDVVSATTVKNAFTLIGDSTQHLSASISTGDGTQSIKSEAFTLKGGKNTFAISVDSSDSLREIDTENNLGSISINAVDLLTITGSSGPAPTTDAPVGSIEVTFSQAIDRVSFNWNSLTLTRDGGANLITGTSDLLLSLVSGSTYRISGFEPLTSRIGDYHLTLLEAGVSDETGTPLTGSLDFSWTMHAATPSAPVLGPSNNGPYAAGYTSTTTPTVVGTATPGSTVELYDQLDNLLDSILVDDSGTYAYTYGTLALGAYQVKARATEPGGYTSASSALSTFNVTKASDHAKALFITQFPAPKTSPVIAVGVQLSTTIDPATFTWEDLDIRLNGSGPNLTNSSINIERANPASLWYRIDLPPLLTADTGVYTFTVKFSGVTASNGKPLFNDLTTTFRRAESLHQITLFPSPVTTPVQSIGFQTSKPIDLSTLDWHDISLSLDGGPDISMSGITIHRVSPTSTWYRINLPASLTVKSGTYTLTVKASGIFDTRGMPFGQDISTTWVRQNTFVQINQFPTPVSSPMTLVGFQSSAELSLASLTALSLQLTLNGNPLSTSGITFERVSPTSLWYRIKFPPSRTLANGTYQLKVLGAQVLDVHGNPMGNDIQTTWTKV